MVEYEEGIKMRARERLEWCIVRVAVGVVGRLRLGPVPELVDTPIRPPRRQVLRTHHLENPCTPRLTFPNWPRPKVQ